MAKYVIGPCGNKPFIIKCRRCKTLYVPETIKEADFLFDDRYSIRFEHCPVCGNSKNNWDDVIPLWKYNLIKWFRGVK